jgi:hypothetical protein
VTSMNQVPSLSADRVRSRERGPALVAALMALGSTLMPRVGAWWLIFAVVAGLAVLVASGRMLTRSGQARLLTWPAQPAAAVGSLWVAAMLAMVAYWGPFPAVWGWGFVLTAIFVGLLGVAALVEMVIHREGVPAVGAPAEYGTSMTAGIVLLAIALMTVSAVLH